MYKKQLFGYIIFVIELIMSTFTETRNAFTHTNTLNGTHMYVRTNSLRNNVLVCLTQNSFFFFKEKNVSIEGVVETKQII